MRKTSFGATLAAIGAVLTLSSIALAGDDVPVNITGAAGKVSVQITDPAWHINTEFPWRVVVKKDGKEVGKVLFTLPKEAHDLKTASVSGVPGGSAKVSGAVCKGASECHPFSKTIDL